MLPMYEQGRLLEAFERGDGLSEDDLIKLVQSVIDDGSIGQQSKRLRELAQYFVAIGRCHWRHADPSR